jgi:hypothetical protein
MPKSRLFLLLLLASLIACIPLATTEILPFVDYPGHLVRVHLLANWDGVATEHEYYAQNWRLLPNLALELITVPIAKLLPATEAMRLFVAASLTLILLGGAFLNRQVANRWTLWSLAPALFLYNKILSYGFLNYIFGLGIVMLAIAWHVRHQDEKPAVKLAFGAVVGLILFMCHLATLGIYAIVALTYDLTGPKEGRLKNAGLTALPLILPAILFKLFSPTGGGGLSPEFGFMQKPNRFLTILQTGQGQLDTLFLIAVVAALAFALALKWLKLDRRMGWSVLALFIAFLIAPFSFGDAANLDTRLPVAVLLFLAASLVPQPEAQKTLAPILIILLAFRFGATAVNYQRWGGELAQIRQDLATVPEHSLLFMARNENSGAYEPRNWNPPIVHASALTLLDRRLYAADLFTNPRQQPLVRTEAFKDVEVPTEVDDQTGAFLEQFSARLQQILDKTRRTEPAYVYYLKENGSTPETQHMDLLIERERYAIYKLR